MSIYDTGITALFSPADRPERASKALEGPADLVILDLEDAVGFNDKDSARAELRGLLHGTSRSSGIVIRINDPASNLGSEDIKELVGLNQDTTLPEIAVMIPKFSVSTKLEQLPEDITVIGLIESAEAVRDLHKIASHPAIHRLALGAVDLSTELGCDIDSATMATVRSQLVVASAAANLSAPLESPCVNFRDSSMVAAAAKQAKKDGFGGMLCIHPRQLDAVCKAFSPSEHDLAWARRVLSVGNSATAIDGEMVDRPVLLRAQRILGTI